MAKETAPTAVKKVSPPSADVIPPLFGLRDEINRLFDGFFRGWPRLARFDPFREPGMPAAGVEFAIMPNVDMDETDEKYTISAELPGMDEKDVSVTVEGGVLSISGEKKSETEEKRKNYHLSERSYGAFRRSFRLPENVDSDRIAAAFTKGVLTVTLPKTAEAKASQRRIEVKRA